ncbi:MAG: hypothetical protein ACREC9_12575 [Methylocella sp.]
MKMRGGRLAGNSTIPPVVVEAVGEGFGQGLQPVEFIVISWHFAARSRDVTRLFRII